MLDGDAAGHSGVLSVVLLILTDKFAVLSLLVHNFDMTTPLIKRGMKLAYLAIGVAACLGFIGWFLPAKFQWFIWGIVAGIFATLTLFLESWLRRGIEPAEVGSASRAQRNRIKFLTAAAVVLGGSIGVVTKFFPDYVQWFLGGSLAGFLVMLGAVLSPLFHVSAKLAPPK
jgi:protein-S-isoprenylcysteine O-methyltransferase Ste14